MLDDPSWPTTLAPLAEDYALVFACQTGNTLKRRILLRADPGAWRMELEYRASGETLAPSAHALMRHHRLLREAGALVSEAMERWLPAQDADRLGLHVAASLEDQMVMALRFAIDQVPPEQGGFLARCDPRDFSHVTAPLLRAWLRACADALPPVSATAWLVETVRAGGADTAPGEPRHWRVTAPDAAGAAVAALVKHRLYNGLNRQANVVLSAPGGPVPLAVARITQIISEGEAAAALGAAARPGLDAICAAHSAVFSD